MRFMSGRGKVMREISRGHLRLVVSNGEVEDSVIVLRPRFTEQELAEISKVSGWLNGVTRYGLGFEGDNKLANILYAVSTLLEYNGVESMELCKDLLIGGIGRVRREYPQLFRELGMGEFLAEANDLLLAFDPYATPIDREWVERELTSRFGEE